MLRRRASVLLFGFVLACVPMWTTVAAAQEESEKIPVTKVVLFSSGVGFFEHNGQVDGNGNVELKFNVDDVNDLLKSMVLQDLGGGRISAVTYESKDPIQKTLQTFAINLTDEHTIAGILQQVRGQEIEVEAPNPVIGKIVGIETRQVPISDEKTAEKEFLNLVTKEGLRRIPWDSITSVKLLDEKLNAELQQALEVLAMSHATDKKVVTLNFLGAGKRQVRVGYVQEAPIWKTSYRLVLSEDDEPLLQGWAIVENPTEEDWSDVDLTLVSGRPISFIQDLYQPLYVQRPTVVPELYASLVAPTYDQNLSGQADFDSLLELIPERSRGRRGADASGGMGGYPGAGYGVPTEGAPPAPAAMPATAGAPRDAAPIDPSQGVQSVAQASDVGELFRYTIATPVTLRRQQSAMLPIVNESVEAEKVSIYNARVHAKHPLNGLKLTNSTELHLMQGPITVFDGGSYAGDARIEDLQPGTERLLSYALDLDVEVAAESKAEPEQLVSVKIVKGTLRTSRKLNREHVYTIKNSGGEEKELLVEQRHDPNWKLVRPAEPEEKTRDLYRFAVTAEPGKTTKLGVAEEQILEQSLALSNLGDPTIVYYKRSRVISPEVEAALSEITRRRQAIAKVAERKAEMEGQVQTVEQEQNRIRQNMQQLDRNSDLYNRYVRKFGEQEDEVERLRGAISEIHGELTKLQQDLDKYLTKLDDVG